MSSAFVLQWKMWEKGEEGEHTVHLAVQSARLEFITIGKVNAFVRCSGCCYSEVESASSEK